MKCPDTIGGIRLLAEALQQLDDPDEIKEGLALIERAAAHMEHVQVIAPQLVAA